MKSIDEVRKEACVYEGRESLKTWDNIVNRLTNERTIEKYKGMLIKKSEIRKDVEESKKKEKMIVFNLNEKMRIIIEIN